MKIKKTPPKAFLCSILEYDPKTGKLKWKVSRHRRTKPGQEAGTFNTQGYRAIHINDERHMIHRIVWKMVYGKEPRGQIDHINGVRHDNRIENLRESTQAENARNMKKSSKNTSGCCGVYWSEQHKKWRAKITVNYIQISLGLFSDFEGAVAARIAAQKKYGYSSRHGK